MSLHYLAGFIMMEETRHAAMPENRSRIPGRTVNELKKSRGIFRNNNYPPEKKFPGLQVNRAGQGRVLARDSGSRLGFRQGMDEQVIFLKAGLCPF